MNYARGFLKTLLQILLLHYSTSLDTITVNQSIRDGDVLVSSGDSFVLGFFSPGKSSQRHIGIWFKFSEETIVWVANRDTPINDTSGVLSIDAQGNLALHRSTSPNDVALWSTNISVSTPSNTVAQLMDSGNLVLLDQQDNKRVLWQSSDHPTNLLLQEVKLGLDFRSGMNHYITSWISGDDPGTGTSMLRMEPGGSPQLFLYKDQVKWWRSGHWNGIQWSGIPAMRRKTIFNIIFLNDQDEITVRWSVLDHSLHSYLVVDEIGVIQQYTWQQQQRKWIAIYSAPVDPCDYYGKCGAFGSCNPFNVSGYECTCLPGYDPKSPSDWALRDGSEGCKKKNGTSMCGNGEGFVRVVNIKLPDPSNVSVNKNLSLEACREECLRNCSCMAFASADVRDGSGCMTWFGKLVDIKQFTEGGQDLYVRVDAIELAKYEKKSKGISTKWVLTIVAASIAITSFLIGSVLYCCLEKRKRKGNNKDSTKHLIGCNTSIDTLQSANLHDSSELPVFDFDSMLVATNHFSIRNKVGQGGFGTVYKGKLHDGKDIAVKRLSSNSGQGIEEFKNELILISKLQHRNLVRLMGCCIYEEEKLLIYEFMPNKSLDSFLFDPKRRSELNWATRFNIIQGVAKGLLYLHRDSSLRVIHRDLKASNILLDEKMNPKIADFGLARIFQETIDLVNTHRVVGTLGYISPEYAMGGIFSEKSDVYSFGVLLLEIVSGKKNNSFHYHGQQLSLIAHAWQLWSECRELELMDEVLADSYSSLEVVRCINVGLLCAQDHSTDRPNMPDVVIMLSNDSDRPKPKQPLFYNNQSSLKRDLQPQIGTKSSTNEATISMIEGR